MKPEELKNKLDSVVVVMTTPFTESDEVDVEGLRVNTRFLIDKSKHGNEALVLVPTGSTGEFYTLSDEERKLTIKTVIHEAKGEVVVMAGTGSAGTKQTIAMSKYAQEAGADGVMVILPYYHVPSEEGMYKHYKALAEDLEIGIMIYNNPDTTKCYIEPSLMKRLAEIPGIVAIKENSNNMSTVYQMQKLVGDKLKVLCGRGDEDFAVEAILGVKGFISMYANFAPGISLDLLEAGKKGDFKAVQHIRRMLDSLTEFIGKVSQAHGPSTTVLPKESYKQQYFSISIVKAAQDLIGLHGGKPRLPLLPISEKEKKELKEILKKLKILQEGSR